MKPAGYPLQWCEALDGPYWEINAALCLSHHDWREWQSRKPMSEIIPEIDKRIASLEATP